jgi:hypothetical protein
MKELGVARTLKPRAPFHREDTSDTEVSQLELSSGGEFGSFERLKVKDLFNQGKGFRDDRTRGSRPAAEEENRNRALSCDNIGPELEKIGSRRESSGLHQANVGLFSVAFDFARVSMTRPKVESLENQAWRPGMRKPHRRATFHLPSCHRSVSVRSQFGSSPVTGRTQRVR